MAKGKSVNPADAFRKAQRKKELKKNKTERQKTRDFALVKKDTSELNDEISKLEALAEPSAEDRARLKQLKNELADINKKKEEYVEAHPEQRKLVYASTRRREQNDEDDAAPKPELKKRNLFKKNGLPRHPERSIYYDPVMNPFGVAPPGMPYVERPLLPNEVDSDAEPEQKAESGDDDDDIAMPEGPPPGHEGGQGEEVDSDDDIPMPEGPPPGKGFAQIAPPLPPSQPPLPPGPPPGLLTFTPPLPPLPSQPHAFLPPYPPPSFLLPPPPPPPQGFAGMPPFPPPPPFPPHAFGQQNFPPPPPPPPPGFFPRRAQATHAALQDPLAPIPQTQHPYQAHRAALSGIPPPPPPPLPPSSFLSSPSSSLPHNPNLPPRPNVAALGASASAQAQTSSSAVPAAISASATITAEPELRDLKKEATAFVPSSLKRKKGGANASSRVNAAPALDGDGKEGVQQDGEDANAIGPQRSDLMGTLQEKFGPMPTVGSSKEDEPALKKRKVHVPPPPPRKTGADDYDKFMTEMKDLLGPGAS
ncbi:hypothetical protein SCHPADRAFT_860472 [Schizopora paradoxa]|uniref:Wbp11/ELF5/Saf1 N-terminal domain-containing protein n=1 Tax=Schizopora paradoxa TaxID=27342 RepID=A0A0H2R7C7_9AGAM|nr:hypothetical protein SCHPADRAFT_860472 [Schizopora paradoxa]